MNYDLDTKQGMKNSIKWLEQTMCTITDGGIWMIPRSGSAYAIRHSDKTAIKIMAFMPDPSLDRVFRAAGWKVVDNT